MDLGFFTFCNFFLFQLASEKTTKLYKQNVDLSTLTLTYVFSQCLEQGKVMVFIRSLALEKVSFYLHLFKSYRSFFSCTGG